MKPDAAPAIAVPRPRAEAAHRTLLRARLLDVSVKPVKRADAVLLPVTDVARALAAVPEGTATTLDAPARRVLRQEREPRERALARLRAEGWPDAALAAVPDKWQKLGDALVLDVPDALRDRERALAEAFAEATDARVVVHRAGPISGEFREPGARVLFGDDTETVHLENGIRYAMDVARVMFSQGNVHERTRIARVDARGETVVDCFAGIGYFALPFAVHAGAAVVHALEKNPVAHHYLSRNAALNGVTDVLRPWLGDNRDFPLRGIADRVHLGYVEVTHAFLDHALTLLKPEGGIVHYHDTVPAHEWRDVIPRRVMDAAARAGRSARVLDAHVVKTYGPGMVHAVADVAIA